MRKLLLCSAPLALIAVLVFAASGLAQATGAPKPPAAAPAAAGQGRGGRGGGPIEGPPHDAHDLSGVWNLRGMAGGGGFAGPGPQLTPFGQDLFKQAKSSNSGEYTLQTTNDPVITRCFPPGVPRIYLQPFRKHGYDTPVGPRGHPR
jgi:hypothetical protein